MEQSPKGQRNTSHSRSAILDILPFRDLGLVIVDEEHENTYKQQDPAPRYHARNAAIVLASMHGAKTLLGSATPALESYYNAQQGKYGFVELTSPIRRYTIAPNISSQHSRTSSQKTDDRQYISSASR